MAKKPDFNDASWDATVWSLWGLLYTGAASDTALKTAISQTFGEVKQALSCLGVQVEPLASMVQDWKDEVAGYARTIRYSEADDVLRRLRKLLAKAREQAESDRLLVEARKKPPPLSGKAEKATPETPAPKKVASGGKSSDEDMSEEAWAERYSNTMFGHSKATAREPHKPATPKQAYVPPTPQQLWKWQQQEMANQCDNGVDYGMHGVDQDSVVRRLDLQDDDYVVKQYREGPATNHLRILKTHDGELYWTLGLTHRELREPGNFSVYRRVGAKSKFVFVSGRRHPKDPGP